MDKKKALIIFGVSTLVVGLGVYLIIRNNRFVPTPASVYQPVDVEIDSSMLTQPDDIPEQPSKPSQEVSMNDSIIFDEQSPFGDYYYPDFTYYQNGGNYYAV
jgi:hypothetical protein